MATQRNINHKLIKKQNNEENYFVCSVSERKSHC